MQSTFNESATSGQGRPPAISAHDDVRSPLRDHSILLHLGLFIALAVAEMLTISWVFEFEHPLPPMYNPVYLVRQSILWGILTCAAFGIISWPQRMAIADWWIKSRQHIKVRDLLIPNVLLFLCLVAAAALFTARSRPPSPPAWGVFAALLIILAATAISLVRIVVPIGSLWDFFLRNAARWACAAGVASVTMAMTLKVTGGWGWLATATLVVSKGILQLYESGVTANPEERTLGIGKFHVMIDQSCSGYEGVGLVAAFLCLYLWVFRRDLRFPQAFLLLPIGIVTIWLLNSVRIAALVSLGAHISPEVAVQGFHSQAGWMVFLAVTIGLMVLSRKVSFFTANIPRAATSLQSDADRQMLAYLIPFLGLMLASIVVAAFAPRDHALYGLKVLAVGAALWAFRDIYKRLDFRCGGEAVLAGAVVGFVWIVTTTVPLAERPLVSWLDKSAGLLMILWLFIRGVGAVIMVPIAEELAFRGFLHRWLISRNFENVAIGQVSIAALVISSLLFGILHDRWIAGALAGAVFALLMYRSGRLSDSIAAHMTANAVIFFWAVAAWRPWLL
jgi:exosortase E/protease (VPEID-CTERM system)